MSIKIVIRERTDGSSGAVELLSSLGLFDVVVDVVVLPETRPVWINLGKKFEKKSFDFELTVLFTGSFKSFVEIQPAN